MTTRKEPKSSFLTVSRHVGKTRTVLEWSVGHRSMHSKSVRTRVDRNDSTKRTTMDTSFDWCPRASDWQSPVWLIEQKLEDKRKNIGADSRQCIGESRVPLMMRESKILNWMRRWSNGRATRSIWEFQWYLEQIGNQSHLCWSKEVGSVLEVIISDRTDVNELDMSLNLSTISSPVNKHRSPPFSVCLRDVDKKR